MTVVDLAEERARRGEHLTGPARCLSCRFEWVAVAPVGTVILECPECHLMRGRFVGEVLRDCLHWVCNCGNDLFLVTAEGFYCPHCGIDQLGF